MPVLTASDDKISRDNSSTRYSLPSLDFMTAPALSLLDAAEQHFRAGRLIEAERLLREIIDTNPSHGEALEGLAYIAANQHDHALAADYFDRAIDALPDTVSRLHDAGLSNQSAGRHERSVQLFEQVLALAPRNLMSMHAAALSLTALGKNERALEMFQRACLLEPASWQIRYNMGRALGLLGRFDEEIAAYKHAIELKPDAVDAYVNLGVALRDLHRFDEALKVFKKAIQIDPNHAGARTNRAQLNLLLGEFEHGWREYEWRWRDGGQQHDFGDSVWSGDVPLTGKTLLLHAEQGMGDTLQFVRYIDLLTGRGARLVLRVQDALLPLLKTYPGVDTVIGASADVPPFDYHCALLSLPHALKTRAAIPGTVPYLFAHAARSATFEPLLDKRHPRIGVAWSGSSTHVNDRNRSMRLADLSPLFNLDATFVSLQKEVREEDRVALAQFPLLDVSLQLDSFADTAALIAQLDLVICVDTAVAHLAGALGKPVWLMLAWTPDWRWGMERTDSAWYPRARLFRQTARGDWTNVVADVVAALEGVTEADASARTPI
jgi:tetratricopeptide (TPR) repeat protein